MSYKFVYYLVNKKDFEKFYNSHFAKVYRFVFFRVGHNKELAEDLVSEIFMKALEHFSSFDPAKSHSAWLMTIAKNHLANYWRDRKVALPLPEASEEGGDSDYVSDFFWLKKGLLEWRQRQNRAFVAELLLELNDNEREIVTFHYIFGYSYAEISQQKGITETAAKVAAHRALKKIRGRLAG